MITIHIKHIALFDTDSDGATVLFPAKKHKLEIKKNTQKARDFRGIAWMEGRTVDGKPVPQRRTQWKKDGRVPGLSEALGHLLPKKVRTASDLIGSKDAAASLRLVGGKFIAQPAEIPAQYGVDPEAKWKVGFIKSTKLTNYVKYELELEEGDRYWLVTDKGPDELEDGDQILITNEDTTAQGKVAGLAGEIKQLELDDFLELYAMLKDKVIGKKPERPTVAGSPTRPLCPVGTP